MSQALQTSDSPEAPDASGASFGYSADGMPVALVGQNAYAMAPGRDGRHYLASGWRIARPMAEWNRSDFYGHGGDLADENAFRAKVLEQAQNYPFDHAASSDQKERRRCSSGVPSMTSTSWIPFTASHHWVVVIPA